MLPIYIVLFWLVLVGSPGWGVVDENSCGEGWTAATPRQLHGEFHDLGPGNMDRIRQIIADRTRGCESLVGPEGDLARSINIMRGEVYAMELFLVALRDRKTYLEDQEDLMQPDPETMLMQMFREDFSEIPDAATAFGCQWRDEYPTYFLDHYADWGWEKRDAARAQIKHRTRGCDSQALDQPLRAMEALVNAMHAEERTLMLFLEAMGERKAALEEPATPVVDERAYTRAFCAQEGGQTEVRHRYPSPTGSHYIRVDCETATTVYEAGLDQRSSLDSLQQAVFAAQLTGKTPVVVIYDTDGQVGPYEYQIRVACEQAGVRFMRVP